jgi:hypothetical protein
MTIFLVNRHLTETKNIQIDVRDFIIKNEPIYLYTLSKLPVTETFSSRSNNALKKKQITAPVYNISVQLEPLSVNALTLRAASTAVSRLKPANFGLNVFPNPTTEKINIEFFLNEDSPVTIEIFNGNGQKIRSAPYQNSITGKNQIETDLSGFAAGIYWISVRTDSFTETRKFIVN